MSLLTIIQTAADRCSLARPTAVTSDTDANIKMMLRLATEEGQSLRDRVDWQEITKEHTFTTVAAAAQTSSVPDDFHRVIPDTMFNRDTNRKVWGPMSPNEWQLIQSSLVTRVDPAFRLRGGTILFSPTPTAGENVYYEYVSKNWCQSSGGTEQSAWAADTDTGILDENMMALGVIWRFKRARGLDYSEEFNEYERRVNHAMQRDGSRPRIYLSEPKNERVPYPPIVPESFTL